MKSGWENLSNTFRSICASFDPVFFFLITVYSSIHVSGNVCVCVCVHVNVHHKDMLFYDESRYSRCHSCKMAFPAKGFMLLMVFELNWCTILLNILVYWFIFPHKKSKKKENILFIPIISLLIHRQASKCAHKAKPLHTFKYFL